MARLYTAGGGGLGVEYAAEWREHAKILLPEHILINPFRGGKLVQAYKTGSYQGIKVFTPNEIAIRDLNDIKSCDGILAEMRSNVYNYIGTSSEIFFGGRILQIPVFVWTIPQYADHPWIVAHSVKVFTGELEEVCDYINEYFV